MKRALMMVAVVVAFAAPAGAERKLPPKPMLGEPLSTARDWCNTVGADIQQDKQPGMIMLICDLSDTEHFTFGGMEIHGYRIESTQTVFLAPYQRLSSSWEGPFYCKPRAGMHQCESYTREADGVTSRALVYFENEQDRFSMYSFHHAISRR
jgi:hypothetical protein